MLRKAFNRIVDEHEWLVVSLLLLLGLTLRLACIGTLPLGLNQDEASAGYDAWALLNYGVDRNGHAWPVLLTSWGSGQNALMSYLAMPFIALFGLSELSLRLVNAIFGCLTLVVFWLLARRTRGAHFALCALFVLVICPWHIMASRWALESNLLPFFLLLAVYFVTLAREHHWAIVGAAASLGLSLYAYGTAFFFIPPFFIFAFLHLRKDMYYYSFFTAFAVFILIAFPISYCQIINAVGGSSTSFMGLALPHLTEGRQLATSVFGGGGLGAALGNFRGFLRIFWTQSDGLPYNALPAGGMFYLFGPVLAVLGLIVSLGTRKDHPGETPMRLALFAGLLCTFLISPNINRLNMLWLPIAYFSAVATYVILRRLKSWAALPVAGMAACLMIFLSSYKAEFSANGSELYFPGLGDAVSYVEELDPESVYISSYVNQPYIFALFYAQPSPWEFMVSADYINPGGAFQAVRSFGHFRFGPAEDAAGEYLILHRSEAEGYAQIETFGHYTVCYGLAFS